MNFTIKGMKELDKALKKIPAGSETAVKKSLTDIALDLQGEAQRRAPVDTGDLRGSAYATVDGKDVTQNASADKHPKTRRTSKPTAKKMQAIVGFTEPYAIKQHEDLTLKHERGGEAKYLENPYKEKKDMYLKDIGDAVKKAVT